MGNIPFNARWMWQSPEEPTEGTTEPKNPSDCEVVTDGFDDAEVLNEIDEGLA